jgi:hypothetical protein
MELKGSGVWSEEVFLSFARALPSAVVAFVSFSF